MNQKLSADMKALASIKDYLKSNLIKCRENCRNIEDSKRSLDRDYKALIVEIKTLKNHLSSNRAIVVEKAVAKEEVVNLKTEIASKCVEVEKSSVKLKKLSNELNNVLVELKQTEDAKTVVETEVKCLKEKRKKMSSPTVASKANVGKEINETLKLKEDELSALLNENKGLRGQEGAAREDGVLRWSMFGV